MPRRTTSFVKPGGGGGSFSGGGSGLSRLMSLTKSRSALRSSLVNGGAGGIGGSSSPSPLFVAGHVSPGCVAAFPAAAAAAAAAAARGNPNAAHADAFPALQLAVIESVNSPVGSTRFVGLFAA